MLFGFEGTTLKFYDFYKLYIMFVNKITWYILDNIIRHYNLMFNDMETMIKCLC